MDRKPLDERYGDLTSIDAHAKSWTVIYSVRSARIGSMREARRAGKYAAVNATAQSSKLTPEKTTGFVGVVPNSREAIHLLSTKEPSVPRATPASASHSVFASTSRS